MTKFIMDLCFIQLYNIELPLYPKKYNNTEDDLIIDAKRKSKK